MLAFLFEPIRVLAAYIESAVLFIAVLFGTGQALPVPGDYLAELNCTGIFDNSAQCALPQTAMHGIVVEHFAKERSDGKAPKCLIVAYDGARADALVNTKDDPESATQALKTDGGGIYQVYCGGKLPRLQKTVTCVGFTTLLTGHWADERGGTGHGVTDNGLVKAQGTPKLLFNNLFELERPIGRAALVVAWDEYFSHPGAVWYHDKAYAEEKGYNMHWLNQAYQGDGALCAAALAQVQDPASDLVMVTLDACDYAGHDYAFGNINPGYVDAFVASEHYGYQLIQAVKARPTYAGEDWLILVITDHGGYRMGHGAQFAVERQIFMAANKDLGI